MIQRLHKEAGICNFHISTLNLERSTRLILEALHLHKQEVNVCQFLHNLKYEISNEKYLF
jgi:biotin synthase-related radical SAM superfamily protein